MSHKVRERAKVPRTLLNTIVKGKVATVKDFGAFVAISEQTNIQGLVHKFQISSAKVTDATEVLQTGDTVWCKVIDISHDNKVALSMKLVDQGSGADLDPAGVQQHLDQQKRKKGVGREERQPIELDAVFQTTCSKCGVFGHLARDCFKSGDGKVYELLPEPEPEVKIFGTEKDMLDRTKDLQNKQATSNTKDLQTKQATSNTKRRRNDSSSSNDVTVKKKKKHHKSKAKKEKKKKKKKKKRHSSSESSG